MDKLGVNISWIGSYFYVNGSLKVVLTFVFESYFRPAMHHAADMAKLAMLGLTAANLVAEINKSLRLKTLKIKNLNSFCI